MEIIGKEPYKPDSDKNEIFPIQVRKMTDKDTKEYNLKKLADLSQKSIENKDFTYGGNGEANNDKQHELTQQENISYEEWNKILVEKYQNLYKTVNETIPELWTPLEFALSIKTILNIRNCTLPFAGILLGPPSSLKTVVVELFRKWKSSYYTDSFTAKTFVSHYAGIKEADLKKIDMLPKIKDKFFLCSELSPTFMKKEDELNEIIGIITRILDGQGLTTDSGSCGQRSYEGEYMFTWLGAAVDIPFRAHKLMGSIGPKLYFLRLPRTKKTLQQLVAAMDKDDFMPKVSKIRTALLEYIEWFDRCPMSEPEDEIQKVIRENNLTKIKWDSDKDDEYARNVIGRIGLLLAHLRGVVPTWDTSRSQGLDYAYATARIEEPLRATTQLRNLARGHALSQGRTWITIEDLPVPIKVVLSTASIDRTNIFRLLIANKGKLTTTVIEKSLNTTAPTAHRIMAELKAVELVDLKEPETETEEKEITLKDEFDWFLGEEFNELLQGFEPSDNSEFVNAFCKKFNIGFKEKTPPCNTETTEAEEKPIEVEYLYDCYVCKRVNHGTPLYQTNSLSDYQRRSSPSYSKTSTMLSRNDNLRPPVKVVRKNTDPWNLTFSFPGLVNLPIPCAV
jgi:hypothetical protein